MKTNKQWTGLKNIKIFPNYFPGDNYQPILSIYSGIKRGENLLSQVYKL